jgi:8-oxo-dGTP diphosphatase
VLLVRHARAGSREEWPGPDDERPLDETGRGQAAEATSLLPLWAPTAVLSAPALRCRQTVADVAERLGTPLEVDDALAEEAAERLPGRLRELGAAGRSLVACSQGRAIRPAVAELTAEAGLTVADPSAPKGSVWALSWADGRLVDADRTDLPR